MASATGTPRTAPARRTKPLRLPRTTGAVSGLLILLLGIWGGLIPFIGPYFHYSFGGDQTWHFTMQRLWLSILPGAVAVLGGWMLLTAASRVGGLTAGWIALVAGAWFAVGPAVALLWDHSIYAIGAPNGGQFRRMLEWVGYFHGLGVLIAALSAFAMGRFFSRPRLVEEPAVVAADAAAAEGAGRRGRVSRTAVADAPVEDRTAVRDAPAERGAYADEPAGRGAYADEPAGRGAYADTPGERGMVANEPEEGGRVGQTASDRGAALDTPADRGTVADSPADRGTVADTPADRGTVADAPSTQSSTGDAPGATAVPTQPTTRRSGGLLGRFRR